MTPTLLGHNRTYGTVERLADGSGWRVTEIEPHVAIKLKAVFPRLPKTGRVPFELRGGPAIDADLAWFMSRYPMRIAETDHARMVERKTLFEVGQAEIGSILSPTWKPSEKVSFRPGLAPYNYQAQAAELVRRVRRLLLMDDLGLGKTISSFAAICHQDTLPAAVVVQAHLPGQWKQRFEEFTHLRVHIIRGTTPYALPPADVYVFKYSNIGGWVDYFEQAPFKAVVCDEAQELRHGTATAKGRAARALLAGADLRLFLTATPIYNYGSEIFHILDLLEPGCLGSWHDFVIEWCRMGPGGKWVVNDPQALGTFLREQHLALRRTEIDVEGEMPPPNVIMHEVPMDRDALARSGDLARQLAMKVTFKSTSFTERGQASREFDMLMRQATGVGKAPHVAAFVRILLAAGQPVLLVGWHREVYEIWQRELRGFAPAMYTGTESPTQKARTVDDFISGRTNLMIISLRSGAGLDGLQQRCSTIVFGELDWSPQVHAQCVGRLRRPGQARQVDVVYLHTDDGSDPSVIGVLGLKASQSQGIVDPLSAPTDQQSDATRIRQLAERFLDRQRARPEADTGDDALPAAPAPPAPAIAQTQASLF
jgi:hypothetical protein